ncbi:Mu-like prophage major head subunit gpT family protein [Nannocystis pusilla]|uniref:Mu-like prophage major head subunit gpT family protein n=1 Tax=Nannocystis pusilla TaxID=889268 RepID=A0A9X3IUM0_9BACT|nr:Mu-like prophage major head subunit gpT family protein [Nannocystis pusilla]MCY1004000.1 Mu-like prophage major head subunit gpT family protein [Nannocystis pusilla]MCY1008525.1 Mu-like prophage major head subunit gpT family protein [Nannocystis pusilla]
MKGKGLVIKNEPYEDTFAMQTRILKTEGGATRYAPRVKMLARGANRFVDELVFATLLAGFTVNGVDGVPFFSASHPISDGVTHSNFGGGAGAPWFLFDPSIVKPVIVQWLQRPETKESDKDEFDKGVIYFGAEADAGAGLTLWQAAYASKQTLDQAAFDAAVAQMMKTPRESGEGVGDKKPLGVMPKLLVVGPSNRAAAKAVLEKEQLANGESNTNYKAVELMVTPYLD